MKHKMHGNVEAGASTLSDKHLDAINGSGISGQDQARRLLDDYLASVDILSQRSDLSAGQRTTLQRSLAAELARKINDAVTMKPT